MRRGTPAAPASERVDTRVVGNMAGRLTKLILAVLLMAAGIASISGTGSADTLQPQPFEMAGKDTSVTAGVVGDTIGKFTLTNTYRRGGNISGKSDPVEITVKQDTKFYQDFDGDGTYVKSDLQGTVKPADAFDVWVNGRFDQTGGTYTLLASNVFSPPPPIGSGGPTATNPAPNLPKDMTTFRLFWAKGTVRFTGTRLVPSCCSSDLWGFEVSPVQQTNSWHVSAIAAAHGNGLRIYVEPTTKYWGSGKILIDRNEVVQVGNTVEVSGRYFWDGIDWRMIATQVVKVPDGPAQPAGGTLGTTATLVRTNDGAFNPDTQSWEGTTFTGRGINFDGQNNGASVGLTLNWTYNNTSGLWEYSGTYFVQKDNGANRLEGQINGTVGTANPGDVTGVMTVDQAYGPWAGWSGYGRVLRGSAGYLGTPSSASPPNGLQAELWWQISQTP